ncbi:MAG: Rieske 2Fe-2S domain-containing protein [Cyanobacteriota bacterium]|nr:Rieske 2Fe-2S domain-containing protein [Cyanobacteriota bacterium]
MLVGAPWLLAHKSMLSIDRPLEVSLYGKDYVLWKDRNNNVRALPNICPHMGAMLSAGWCEAQKDGSSKVVCPFHALEFDAEGCTVLPGSGKKTKPLLEPLELVVRGDFVWSYGGHEPQRSIPDVLDRVAATYEFVGATADTSVATPLLAMLLNNHDYNHQNGTHRDLFRIEEVQFQEFIDRGHDSEAFFRTPTASPTWHEIRRNPAVLMLPKAIEAHLENHFPSLVILHAESAVATLAQCHLFVPEAENRTRTYILMFAKPKSIAFKVMKKTFLNLSKTVVAQDTDILTRLYADQPQKIKLNNEVGMDWVYRNFKSWPAVAEPNLSR